MDEYDLEEDALVDESDSEQTPKKHARGRWIVTAVAVAAVAAFLFWPQKSGAPTASSVNAQSVASTVQALQHRSPTTHPKAYVVDANAPLPTNKWFSGLVFAKPSNDVFAYPLSYAVSNTAAELSYAPPTATADDVFAEHTPAVHLAFASDASLMKSYDDLSVVESFQKSGAEIATTRMTEGSPYMFGTINGGQTATLTTAGGTVQRVSSNELLFKVSGQAYGMWASSGTTLESSGTGSATLVAGANATFAVFVLPTGANANDYFAAASSPVTATSVTYDTQKNGQTTTTLNVKTSDGQPTFFGLQPWQMNGETGAHGKLLGLEGEQTFFSGNAFAYSLSGTPQTDLSLGVLTSSDKAAVVAQLKTDIANTTFASDSYNGGKTMYRAANLVNLAYELGQTAEAKSLQAKLTAELDLWLNPSGYKTQSEKYFYYDDIIKGIVGVQPSYGSDEFNDHQFHYGYMIYAASVVAQHDPNFMKQHEAMIQTIVSDIASPSETQYFPKLRVFDQYLGHSWADGYGQFADGANQESSSEAVLAWAAIYRWGKVSGDSSLENEGLWLYQEETNSALTQNLNIDLSQPQYAGYQHDIVANLWGGKLDYATWFSPTADAKLGIELVPMSPAHTYVGDDKARVLQNLGAMNKELGGARPTQFNDYFAMYEALADPTAARRAVAQLTPGDIDNGDSLAYVMAWVDSYADKK
ncbi:MAG TPA: glycosyl hydrolase [Candidatus Saccharimonadales bacterium]